MGKLRRIVLAAFAALILGGMVWLCLHPAEPVYAERPLHYWIELLEGTSPGFDPAPPWNELGQEEFPVLVKALEFRDSRFHNIYPAIHQRIWQKIPVSILRHLPRPVDTETLAINALLELEEMQDPERRSQVDTRSVIPILIRLVKTDKADEIRMMAASELGFFAERTKNKEVLAVLTAALRDKAPSVRQFAADSIERVDPEEAGAALKQKRTNGGR
jgi:hypothetical protein